MLDLYHDYGYKTLSEQAEESKAYAEYYKHIIEKYPPLDKELLKDSHVYTKNEIKLLLERSEHNWKSKKNDKTMDAYIRVFENYLKTDNQKMVDRMIDIFNKYLKVYNAGHFVEKSFLSKHEYDVSNNTSDIFCHIDAGKLPNKLNKAIIEKDQELDNIRENIQPKKKPKNIDDKLLNTK